MTVSRTLLAAAALGTVTLSGCKNAVDVRQEVVFDVQSGNYVAAEPKLNDLYDCHLKGELEKPGASAVAGADSFDGKNELLWRMERGAIDVIKGDVRQADVHLDRASQLVVERRTESMTRNVAAYLANDTVSEYAGNGYEHVQVDYLRVLADVLSAQRQQGIMAKAAPDERYDLDTAVQAMNNVARGMVLEKIQFNQDNAPDLRYFDDPFARTLSAAMVLATPPELRARDDLGFAFAQMTRALRTYKSQKKVLGGDGGFRYEAPEIPDTALALAGIIGRAYDPEGLAKLLDEVGVKRDDPRVQVQMGKDQGLLLLLNHADWITPTDRLIFDLKVNMHVPPEITKGEAERGVTVTGYYTWYGTTFYAKGPNSEIAKGWGGLVAGIGEMAKFFGVAKPGTWIGWEIPTHRADRPIPTPGGLVVDGTEHQLQVVEDLDAYARATLKDRQPHILTKTIGRVVAKHIIAEVAAKAAEEGAKKEAQRNGNSDAAAIGWLTGMCVGGIAHATASASESADTRYWSTLPDRIEGGLAVVATGKHQIAVRTAGGSQQLGEVTVPAGRLVIVPARTFPSPVPSPYAGQK